MWGKKLCCSPTVSANSATFTLLRDLYKRGGRKGWWVLWGRWQLLFPLWTALLYCSRKKMHFFGQTAYHLKLSYVNDNVETLLLLRYRKIDNAVTSLLCPIIKWIQFLFCGMEKMPNWCISASGRSPPSFEHAACLVVQVETTSEGASLGLDGPPVLG